MMDKIYYKVIKYKQIWISKRSKLPVQKIEKL
jgi:hypothetical protein